MKKENRLLPVLLSLLLLAALLPVPASAAEASDMGASYTETTDPIANPERGFYSTFFVGAQETGNAVQNPTDKLVHMRISLGNFSHNYLNYRGKTPENYTEGGWEPLSQDFLDALSGTLDRLRQNGGSAILRFAYDDFDGVPNLEPDMEGVLTHIQQLSPLFEENADVIAAVESGFLGNWGEQHTSAIVTPENIAALVDALLEAVPEPITVSVRRPLYYCYAAGLSLSDLAEHRADPASPYYRVGVYNDGYLGSGSDLGTYTDRAMEVAWLDYQAGHTLFGGEVVANYSEDGVVYNSIDYISQEMFQTHTSYLNIEWNGSVIDQWRESTYTGDDPVYYGLSGFTYVENHLGYRFVLRGARYCGDRIEIAVENVGAGNVLKPKTVTLNLVDEAGEVTRVPTGLDVMDWQSRQTAEAAVPLPQDLLAGTYTAYLEIADENGNQIRFANDNPFNGWGNGIGTFTRAEAHTHTPEVRDARPAGCTAEGYTGDTYCASCGALLSAGSATAPLGHDGVWSTDGGGTHRQICRRCGEELASGACTDDNRDGACDICGGAYSETPVFQKKTSLTDGRTYLIAGRQRALGRDLSGTAVQMTEEGGVYTASPAPDDALLWTYEDGKLWCQADGTRYYLAVDGDSHLSTTTQAGSAAIWSFSGNRLSTQVSARFLFWTYDKTCYLYPSGSGFTLSILPGTLAVYEAV